MSEIDYSKTNPALHYLYVTTAMEHLVALRSAIKKLSRANFNWHGPTDALITERAKLLKENAAYQEAAWRILAGQIVKSRPLDDTPEGGIDYSDADNLCIYDTVSGIWIEKPAPGIFKPASLGPDQATLDAVKAMQNSDEPGHINLDGKNEKDATPVSEVNMSRRDRRRQKRSGRISSGGAKTRNQAEIVRQGVADRKRRKEMTKGLCGIWIYGRNETTPHQLHETYGSIATAEREAKKYRQDTGRPCKVSKPNGCWSAEA